MKNLFKKIGAVALAGAAVVTGQANAAIAATDLQAIQTAVEADLAVIVPWALTFMGIVLATVLGFKLIKRFTGMV